jgi:SOS-response transcriptional repressor LexA
VTEPWIDAEWIRDRLQATGKTQRALAQALELDPSAVSRLLDGSRQLKAHEIPRVVEFFQGGSVTPEGSVRGGSRAENEGAKPLRNKEGFSGRPADPSERHRATPGPRPRAKPSPELPVLGPLVADRGGLYVLERGVAERRPSPPQLTGVPSAYALFVPDDQLAPRYRAGEVIYIHPSRPPTVGSFVVVRFRSPEGRVAIGEVTFADARTLGLRLGHLDDNRPRRADELALNMVDIGQIGRIVVASTE